MVNAQEMFLSATHMLYSLGPPSSSAAEKESGDDRVPPWTPASLLSALGLSPGSRILLSLREGTVHKFEEINTSKRTPTSGGERG